MRKIAKNTLTAVGLSIALLGAGATMAGPGFGGGDTGHMLQRLSKKLELSDSQQTQIRQLFEDGRSQGEADRERLHQLREELAASRDSFDEGKVQAAADEIGQITSRMTYRMAATGYQVRQVLSDEQRAEMDAMMEKHKERKGRWHRGERSDDTE